MKQRRLDWLMIAMMCTIAVGCGRPEANTADSATASSVQAAQTSSISPTVQQPALKCDPPATASPLPSLEPHPLTPPGSDPESLTRRADLIVLGTVGGPAVMGELPPGSNMELPQPAGEPAGRRQLFTEVPIEVECVLKGTAGAIVRARTLGGIVNGFDMSPTHQARLRQGDRVIVFLRQTDAGAYNPFGETAVYVLINDVAFAPLIVDSESGAIGSIWRLPTDELLQRIANNK